MRDFGLSQKHKDYIQPPIAHAHGTREQHLLAAAAAAAATVGPTAITKSWNNHPALHQGYR